MDPTALFQAIREYNDSADNAESKGFARCATVDANYTGLGPARVLFDGETVLSQKEYHFLDNPPRASTRVAMFPIGNTYLIMGMINGGV